MAHQTHGATSRQLSSEMQQCITDCLACASSCLQTIQHCLQMGGKHAEADHIRTMRDCAEICQTSANFMLVQSPLHSRTCGVCAEACTRCADSCESVDSNDRMMQECAKECRRCAQSCQKMAGMTM